MSGFELRPLSLGELLDRAFLLYRRNFWLFAGIMLTPACILLPLQFFMLRERGVPFPWDQPAPQSHTLSYTYSFLFIYWLLYAVVQAAATYATSDAYLGRRSSVREAYGKVRGHYWRVIGLAFNVGIRVLGLMLLFVTLGTVAGGALAAVTSRGTGIPSTFSISIAIILVVAGIALAVWFSLRYAVSLPAVLIEDIKGRAAIRRSVDLSRGRRGQILVAILLGMVIIYSLAFLFQGPFYVGIALMKIKGQLPNWLILGMSISNSVGGVIAGPLLMIILGLFYYDLRVRREAFDLQQLMSSLPQASSGAASGTT